MRVALRAATRLLRVVLHLLAGLVTCAVVFPRAPAARREAHVRRWSAKLLAICQVRLEVCDTVEGTGDGAGWPAAGQRSLVVCNHVSWLDIFVINALQPCRFVAKSDIRDWPLLGYLCAQAGTIFISRGSPRDVRRTFKNLVASIEAGERVAFFPEGTTAVQGALLPFHANLFEAAIDASVPIQPLALRYLDADGVHHPDVEFVGDTTFAQSMLTILRGRGVRAQLTVLPAVPSAGGHRRALAVTSRAHIATALDQAGEIVSVDGAAGA